MKRRSRPWTAPAEPSAAVVRVVVHSPHRLLRYGLAGYLDDVQGIVEVEPDAPDIDVLVVAVLDAEADPPPQLSGPVLDQNVPTVFAVGTPADDPPEWIGRRATVVMPLTMAEFELVRGIRAVARDGLNGAVEMFGASRLTADPVSGRKYLLLRSEPVVLSEQEITVLRLLADGQDGTQIAELLGCSTRRVKYITRHLVEALGARNRMHAVSLAIRAELI